MADSRDLDENTLIDMDAQGQMLAITIEHARDRADLAAYSYEQVGARAPRRPYP